MTFQKPSDIEAALTAALAEDEVVSRTDLDRVRQAIAEVEASPRARTIPLAFPLRAPEKAVWLKHARSDLEYVPQSEQDHISDGVHRFVSTGHGDIRKVFGEGVAAHALRVGHWRIFFQYDAGAVLILRVLPRNRAYRA